MTLRWNQRPQVSWPIWFVAEAVTAYATWIWLRPVQVPPIGFPGGVAVAAVLVSGPWAAIPVWLGAVAGAFISGARPLEVVFIAGVAFEALVVWALLRYVLRSRSQIAGVRDTTMFFVAAAVAGLLDSAVGAWPLARFATPHPTAQDVGGAITYLWTSQLLGMLLVAPPFLSCAGRDRRTRWDRSAIGTGVAVACMLGFGALIFFEPGATGSEARFLPLVVLPLSVWIAMRGPAPLALAAPAAFMLIAVAGTANHRGVLGGSMIGSSLVTLEALGTALAATCLAIVATDTARREALSSTAEREAQLRRVLEGSHDGFWDWDARAAQLHVSARVTEIVGGTPGRWPEDFQALAHADDRAAMRRSLADHLEGRSDHYQVEYRVRGGDDEWVWVLERGRAIERDASGRPVRVSGTLTDVTARRRAEEESVASRELFERFMEHVPALVGIRDDEGRVLYVNPAFERAIWGDRPPEWRNRLVADVLTPQAAAHLQESDGTMDENGGSIVVTQGLVGYDGPIHLLTVKFRLRDSRGKAMVCAVAMDVTAQRQAEEQRRSLEARMTEAQKLESLGLLAGGVAHDFNNILTSILGYADLAREQLSSGSPARGDLEQIVAGARRAGELTRQMLAYAGHGGGPLRPLDLAALIEEMGHLLQVSIPKRVALRYDFAPGLPAVDGDDTQLRQVVMNLILNAAEAIGERSGTIVVRLRSGEYAREALASRMAADEPAPGRYLEMQVADDGCGMSAETMSRIFDPFFTTKFEGRGLGLAAVLGIVRAHRGVVTAESTLRAGTTFRVLLPVSSVTVAVENARRPAAGWRAHGTALVVDDEPSVRGLACAMLRRLGFDEVLVAGGGREALTLLRAHAGPVRLVLLDVTMPEMDGESTFVALRGLRPGLRVLLSSGYAEPAWRDDVLAGVAGFVAKPYRIEDLERAVRAALDPVSA